MKNLSVLLVFLFALFSFVGCNKEMIDTYPVNDNVVIDQDKEKLHKSKLQNREFESLALRGNAIGNSEVRKMQVYTPPGYHPTKGRAYPVVYLLHGMPISEKAFIDFKLWEQWLAPDYFFKYAPDFPQEGFRNWLDGLIESETIEPMIIVTANAETVPYVFSWYTNSALNGNFEDYIVNDLVQFIDSRYNTIASREGRYVIGFSQGGYGAIKIGMKHSDKFSIVAAHGAPLHFDKMKNFSPILQFENPDGMNGPNPSNFVTSGYYSMAAAWSPNLLNPPFFVDLPLDLNTGGWIPEVWDKWKLHDPYTMLETYHENLKQLDGLYIDCGSYDEFGWNHYYDEFEAELINYGIDYFMDYEYPGGHFEKMFERLAKSLEYCSDMNNP